MRELENANGLAELVVGQYVRLTGPIDQMFQVIGPRVVCTASLWRVDPFKGVGSCTMDKPSSETGISGVAKQLLITLREDRSRQIPGISTLSPCPYHRDDFGCVLGELKSPWCLSVMEAAWELRVFGIDGYILSRKISAWLDRLLVADTPKEVTGNEGFIDRRAAFIQRLANHISRFPELTDSERLQEVERLFRARRQGKVLPARP